MEKADLRNVLKFNFYTPKNANCINSHVNSVKFTSTNIIIASHTLTIARFTRKPHMDSSFIHAEDGNTNGWKVEEFLFRKVIKCRKRIVYVLIIDFYTI
jgi:hypothetical protein